MPKIGEVMRAAQAERGSDAGSRGGAGQLPAVPQDASAEELEAMLEELIKQYKDPSFQAELSALQERCLKSGVNMLFAMGPVVLKVQAPVLQKYGQPPSPQGVDNMKHAVQRRVAEGSDRVEQLANEARALLKLDPMPDRYASVEKVLAAKAEETSTRFGIGSKGNPVLEAEFEKLCRTRIAADRQSGALVPATASYLEELLNSKEAPVPSVLALLKMAKHGVTLAGLQGLSVPEQVHEFRTPASATDFFKACVLPSRPAVFHGVLGADRFPPLRDFPDQNFLRRQCGHRRVLVKSLAHEDQQGRPVFVTDPELKLPFVAFLDSVQDHVRDGTRVPFYLGKVPLRKELPELADAIEQSPTCPQREYGSCFGDLITEGVFTYFGCGRNTTSVHFDANENLLICLCGSKRLLLYPPSDSRYLYPCNDFTRSAVVPFASLEDLPKDVQQTFALISHARPLEVNLVAGDMLYLPACWWHCVEGSDEPNMILNWWFALHPDKKALARAGA